MTPLQGGLPMVNVGNNAEVSDISHIIHKNRCAFPHTL